MPTNPRVAAVQGRRRSNAATPHGTGRRPALDVRQAIAEDSDDFPAPGPMGACDPEHAATYEQDYSTRFRCSCGKVSGYYTSRQAAEEAHDDHAYGDDSYVRTPGTTPDH
jgi:hypothetical protein